MERMPTSGTTDARRGRMAGASTARKDSGRRPASLYRMFTALAPRIGVGGRGFNPRAKIGERGLTLVELLVVLALVAMVVLLSAPLAIRSLPGVELRAQAEDLRGDLRAARAMAMRSSRQSWVTLDTGARTYQRRSRAEAVQLPETTQIAMVIARSELTGPAQGRIRFYPDGTSTGGTIRLARDGHRLEVQVDWFFGQVRVVEPDAE